MNNENEEYLTETYYVHEHAHLNPKSDGTPNPSNLYFMASLLLTTAYCAHKETKDNGEAPRARAKEILGDWLTEERGRKLFLRHRATLGAAAEEIAERLYQKI
jgi:hypothetical protein